MVCRAFSPGIAFETVRCRQMRAGAAAVRRVSPFCGTPRQATGLFPEAVEAEVQTDN